MSPKKKKEYFRKINKNYFESLNKQKKTIPSGDRHIKF